MTNSLTNDHTSAPGTRTADAQPPVPDTLRYAVVLDFEATCDDNDAPNPQEVIEFPSVLVDVQARCVVDEFSTFVKPVHHPVLRPFCTALTSITQADVQEAPVFADVLDAHQAWLASHGVTADNAVITTCGDWDMNRMFVAQCRVAEPPVRILAPLYVRWANLKVLYCDVTGEGRAPGMPGMLRAMDLPLVGHHHRGIDDCRNLARLLLTLLERGATLAPTGAVAPKRYPPLPVVLHAPGQDAPHAVTLTRRSVQTLRSVAGAWLQTRTAGFALADGTPLSSDDALYWLPTGTAIHVEPRGA